jgi:hypothetical protein
MLSVIALSVSICTAIPNDIKSNKSHTQKYSEQYEIGIKCSDEVLFTLIGPNAQETARAIAKTAFSACSRHWQASAEAFMLSDLNTNSTRTIAEFVEIMSDTYLERAEKLIIWVRAQVRDKGAPVPAK